MDVLKHLQNDVTLVVFAGDSFFGIRTSIKKGEEKRNKVLNLTFCSQIYTQVESMRKIKHKINYNA